MTNREDSLYDFVVPRDAWELSRREPRAYQDWQYEVANGDTVRGFLDWFIANVMEGDP